MSNISKNNNKKNKIGRISRLLDNYVFLKNFLEKDKQVKGDLITYIFSYKYISRNTIDTFFENQYSLLDWYKTKNPNFKIMNVIDIEMPEFNILLATIAFNCIKILIDNKYPTKTKKLTNYYNNHKHYNFKFNNTSVQSKRFHNILKDINDIVKPKEDDIHIFYKPVINLCIKFAYYVTNINNEEIDFEEEKNNKYSQIYDLNMQINEFMNTPIIIYPTFNQISKLKVIRTMSAPVVNCNINYTNSFVHGDSYTPIRNLLHDIKFHGEKTHKCVTGFKNNNEIYQSVLSPFFLTLYINLNSKKLLELFKSEDSNMILTCIIDLIFHFYHEQFSVCIPITEYNLNTYVKNFYKVLDKVELYNIEAEYQISQNIIENTKKFLEDIFPSLKNFN